MAGLGTILHCIVDPEPKAFHQSDLEQNTRSFAANLSVEVQSDGVTSGGGVSAEEHEAKSRFVSFLKAARDVRFYLFRVNDDWTLERVRWLTKVSETSPADPQDLLKWLDDQKNPAETRYWTTLAPTWNLDVDSAAATHRLRAVQSWNAPVGHRHALTHILRVDLETGIEQHLCIVLPYFDASDAPPVPPQFKELPGTNPQNPSKSPADIDKLADTALDYAYDAGGDVGEIICRTNAIGNGVTNAGPTDIDPKTFTPDGYLRVDRDADNLRRLLKRLEESGASLMAANPALAFEPEVSDDAAAFKRSFNIVASKGDDEKTGYLAGPLIWYAATRLICALDNIVIALLKPGPAGSPPSEGEVLAPFVSLLASRIGQALKDLGAASMAPQPAQLLQAIRDILSTKSPLMSAQSVPAQRAAALRRVYGLGPIPSELDEHALIAVLLDTYAAGSKEIGALPPELSDDDAKDEKKKKQWQEAKAKADIHRQYLASILDQSADVASRALGNLEQTLHEEAGAETAILRLIETVEDHAPDGVKLPDLLTEAIIQAAKIDKTANVAIEPAIKQAVTLAWTDYRAVLDSPFNGAEAVRRAAASTFLLALLTQAELSDESEDTRSDQIRSLVCASWFYTGRFFDELPPVLAEMNKILATPVMDDWLSDEIQLGLRELLTTRWIAATAWLQPARDAVARFIPDSAPQPLSIQIAANIDGSKTDMFAKHFNGIAVAIRRDDGPGQESEWAHAHLCDLTWSDQTWPAPKPDPKAKPSPATTVRAALAPMLPGVSDGRAAMFIEYEGFPFSDAATDARLVESDGVERRAPFYGSTPHEGAFAKVPRLAYGRRFRSFAFVTSNAGTLPLALQTHAGQPWMPAAEVEEPGDTGVIDQIDYQRRTAISQMAVAEQPPAGQLRRIGAEIDGVLPLARDYPRLGLRAVTNEPAVRDLFRESDGVGMMTAGKLTSAGQKPENASWHLTGLRFGGRARKLTLRFFNRPAKGPDDAGDAEFVVDRQLDTLTAIDIAVEYRPDETDDTAWVPHIVCGGVSKPIQAGGIVSGWLRLTLETETHATLSLDNPVPQKVDNVAAPLLLLAPEKSSKIWTADFGQATAIISTPRVGYLDFERWFANDGLRDEMFLAGGDKAAARKSVELFEQSLLYAYVMRHLDSQLAVAVDRLPDPAVESVLVELTQEDALDETQETDSAETSQRVDLKTRLRTFVRDFRERVRKAGLEVDSPAWTPLLLRRHLFEPLEDCFQFQLVIASGTDFKLAQTETQEEGKPQTLTATVPEGMVARLSMDALVPARHFEKSKNKKDEDEEGENYHPPVFHVGLLQYATRKLPGYMAFPAAAIRAETMHDGIDDLRPHAIALAAEMIRVQPIEQVRNYGLTTKDEAPSKMKKHWRLLGEIDVTTQRFRASGRPIYHHINPREYQQRAPGETGESGKANLVHPAMPLALDDEGGLVRFELEAFFDRSDLDAQTVTQRLDPLPACTRLQDFPWNSESATYFRHRFTLRSRYAGALRRKKQQEAQAWPPEQPDGSPAEAGGRLTPAHGWTVRVAMLADLSRLLLTRPQLRALIPLTATPGDDRTRPAPPVAAILQEPPFARGGLADRIAAEIKTGFGYGFEKDGGTVEILDSRKEGGANPHLDYRALAQDSALGLVARSEGPLGLTFDRETSRAPAFANSMQLLQPDTLYGKSLPCEEFFAGFSMRRYIDPNWTLSPPNEFPLDGESCWWIDIGIDGALPETGALDTMTAQQELDAIAPLLSFKPIPAKDETAPTLLGYNKGNGRIEFHASKLAIDGVGGTKTDWVEITRIAAGNFDALSILHQPVAPGRYSTAIFARKKVSDIGLGHINTPLLLAGFEWSPPKIAGNEPDDDAGATSQPDQPRSVELRFAANIRASACRTMASAPTQPRWIKTSLDFDFVTVAELDAGPGKPSGWKLDRIHVRDLAAALETNHEHLTVQRAGSDDPAWLVSSTFANPYPSHVQRHIALITSRFLQELGQPTEIFCRTSADIGKRYGVVTADGKLRPDANTIFKPQETIVRVVEFETPAAILGYPVDAIPPTYRQAYFDLLSTGFGTGKQATLRMHMRFVGPPDHLRKLTRLGLTLTSAVEKTRSFNFTVEWKNDKAIAVGLLILLQRGVETSASSGTEPTIVTVDVLRSDGTVEAKLKTKSELFELTGDTKSDPGFFLEVSQASFGSPGAGPPEFWCDVSLLHHRHAYATRPFDLRWLFSNTGDGDPADQVSAAKLTDMTEAQARIVRVSPPIPIVRH